jgi:hypothetical protein
VSTNATATSDQHDSVLHPAKWHMTSREQWEAPHPHGLPNPKTLSADQFRKAARFMLAGIKARCVHCSLELKWCAFVRYWLAACHVSAVNKPCTTAFRTDTRQRLADVQVLAELGVRQLIVASLVTLKSMWRDKFGFQQLTVDEAAIVEDILVLTQWPHLKCARYLYFQIHEFREVQNFSTWCMRAGLNA